MGAIGIILKIIGNIGMIVGDIKDFEQAAKDLFAGKLTKAEVLQLIQDLMKILGSGFINLPGIDLNALQLQVGDGSAIVDDLIKAVTDSKASLPVKPDIKQALLDLSKLVRDGQISNLAGFTKEQIAQVFEAISAQL